MAYPSFMNFERISEEAHGGGFPCLASENQRLLELGFDELCTNLFAPDFPVAGECDYERFNESIAQPVEPNELDVYLGQAACQNPSFERDDNRALMNNSPMKTVVKEKQLPSNTKRIQLSQSVGVGQPLTIKKPSHQISIVNDLEEFFRPRYKSDYFAQSGKRRKPRYVADRLGNHFITLKVPLGVCGAIRVDWLTVRTGNGDRYTMPYKFQQSNESTDVSDCNPIYIPINSDSLGNMKIYLVLIKSKQDELKFLQPLKPFRPFQDAFGRLDKNDMKQKPPLNPKQLIQMYQLDKSQLACTFCILSSDGKSWIPEWDTTVYSTVLTELQPESSKQKNIACPNCTHVFQLSMNTNDDNDNDGVQVAVANKRKANRQDNEELVWTVKKPKGGLINWN